MAATATRVDSVAELLGERSLDLLLIADAVNLRYVTGFTGSNGLALIGAETRTFITDFRYSKQAADEVAGFEHAPASTELFDGIEAALPAQRPLRLGYDDAHVTVKAHRILGEKLPDDVALIASGGLVERLRAIKSPQERELVASAARLADEALETILGRGLVGRTERAVAIDLEQEMRLRGASGPAFASIVAAGAHGALPHASPRDVEIPADALVIVDWGAELDGYCSDCTRTFTTGSGIGATERAVYELVREAQQAALGAVSAEAAGRGVDAVARDLIAAAGYGEQFGHGLGHGVGIEVHERPRLSRLSDDKLVAGNVVSVEPGVYIPGRFGVRIEDLVVVGEDGCEVLTHLPKELTVVD
ncbi:MAG: M24 family metallopeptidase [Solirubrobacteraceae bacterium]|nr:MAG: aminopeptidase P family protein [Solirubrobacterales bacterium]